MKKRNNNYQTDASIPLLNNEVKPTRRVLKQKTRLTLISGVILSVFGISCVMLLRQLPSTATTSSIISLTSENNNGGINEFFFQDNGNQEVVLPGISTDSFKYGLKQCQDIKTRSLKSTNTTRIRHRNPRASASSLKKPLLIKNGHIWIGDDYLDGDILIENGLITKVGKDLVNVDDDDNVIVLDAENKVVTPGIVDMHSHMGVYSLPGLNGNSDGNEMTNPTTPYVRVIDALSPTDPAIKMIASGGVTTSLVLPGSGNSMGGEAAVVKHRPLSTLSVDDMLASAGVEDEDEEKIHRYMKMACGENPKSYYGAELNKMPMTRMGEGFLFRQQFEKARKLLRSQNDWCDAADRIVNLKQDVRLSERFPEDIEFESLVALLRGDVKLNVHCYLPHDLEAMVRHSLEYDFEIAAFHHALSAWQVPDIIKRAKSNITVATFGDMWGYKHEGWNTNVHAPDILTDAGIPVAFKSDHSVTNARDLMHEAQKAYHYGFDEHKALSSLTSIPANALGLGHRLGSIEVGKDADIVIWERHPLRLGARPKKVIIDGEVMDFRKSWGKDVEELIDEKFLMDDSYDDDIKRTKDDSAVLPERPNGSMRLEDHGLNNPIRMEDACSKDIKSFVLRNIERLVMGPDQEYKRVHTDATTGKLVTKDIYLVVENDHVVCAGPNCSRQQVDWPTSSPVFDMNGATVIPGIISSGVSLGLIEIQAEPSTADGATSNDIDDSNLPENVARAVDGIKLGGLHMKKAFLGGVTTTVSPPIIGTEPLAGVAVATRIGVKTTVLEAKDIVLEEEAALHFVIGHGIKKSVSQQISGIRRVLINHVNGNETTNIFTRAVLGQVPVVVQVDDKDEIASIIQIKQLIKQQFGYSVQFIILGGAEAHLVAIHLQKASIPVILMPARCVPQNWSQRLCLPGHPYTKDTILDVLLRHHVKVGIASTDIDNGDARNLIWEAGWNLAHNQDFTFEQAVGLVTWNIADMFNLENGKIQLHHKADFVAYNGNPFEFGTKVLMVNGGGHQGPLCVNQKDIF